MSSRKRTKQQPRQSIPTWLPLIVIAGVVLIVVAVSCNGDNPAARQSVPQISGSSALKVDKEKVDLGNVKLGQTVSVSFEITNVGDQPLRFTEAPYIEVAAGC